MEERLLFDLSTFIFFSTHYVLKKTKAAMFTELKFYTKFCILFETVFEILTYSFCHLFYIVNFAYMSLSCQFNH